MSNLQAWQTGVRWVFPGPLRGLLRLFLKDKAYTSHCSACLHMDVSLSEAL